jgi:hypothetical protein
MIRYPNAATAVLLFCALQAVVVPKVSAYVLQGQHVLELMTQRIGTAHRLKVTQQLFLYEGDRGEHAVVMTETLRYVFPEKLRSDIQAENIRRVHVVSGDVDLTIIDGEITVGTQARFDSYADVLRFRSRKMLIDRLLRYGVDAELSSLGRFEGRIAFVLGTNDPDDSVSQLWIDKDTFRPIRWIVAKNDAESPGDFLDIRYFQWKHVGKLWYPFRVEFHNGERLVREIRVDDVVVDPGFDEDFFNIEQMRSLYGQPLPADDGRAGEEEISEVQNAIEKFKKIYE